MFGNIFNFTKKNKKIILITIIIFLSILTRILISKIGTTYDLESFNIVGNLIIEGKNVYSETHRYNYAPIWAYILGFFKKISYAFDNNYLVFRLLIITTLSIADISIAFWLWKQYNFYFFLFFLFNPLSIYTTGYHNQFDNLAIAFALWSSVFISKKNFKNKFLGYLLLSLSICIKHIFIFIIPWLFLKEKKIKEKISALMPIFIFIISFLPFTFSKQALTGIWKNVFTYQVASNIYSFFFFKGISRPFVILGLFLICYFLIKKLSFQKQFIFYLLFITALSPIAASQYLIIPIAGHLIVNPLLAVFYIIYSVYFIFFKVSNFSSFAVPIFQLSTLSLLIYFFPVLFKKIKFLIIFLIIFINIVYTVNIFKELKNIYQEQRKEIFIMKVFYPIKKVFYQQKNLLKKPLTKDIVFKGKFTAKENNLGFIAVPFQLENPSGVDFFKKNYQIGATIIENKNFKKQYTEIRPINTALTQDGIILGFPIQEKSKLKEYQLSVFSTIPQGKDFVIIDRHKSLETRYFLTKDFLKNPLNFIFLFWQKINYLLSLKNIWFLLFKIYIIFWSLIFLFIIIKKQKLLLDKNV